MLNAFLCPASLINISIIDFAIGINLAVDLPITLYRIPEFPDARSEMSKKVPQAAVNGSASPEIVVRTVHGDVISVRIDQLGRQDSARSLGDLHPSEPQQQVREAG